MSKHGGKRNRAQKAVSQKVVQPTQPVPQNPKPRVNAKYAIYWRSLPSRLWAGILALIAVIGLYAAYPSLSINQDYTFDAHNPYNTSFSVSNEGYLTAHNLTSVCVSTFEYIPPPDAKILLGPLTTTTPATLFAEALPFKERASIPCNHNIAANGHPLMPGATLHMTVSYEFLSVKITRNFNFYAVLWWDNTYRWEYGDLHETPGGTISLSGNQIRERN